MRHRRRRLRRTRRTEARNHAIADAELDALFTVHARGYLSPTITRPTRVVCGTAYVYLCAVDATRCVRDLVVEGWVCV